MINYSKKNLTFLLAVFILTAIFSSGILDKRENYWAEASFWNTIKAWVTINPLSVKVAAPLDVQVNKVFKITAEVVNKGEEKINNTKGEIFLPREGIVFLKKNPVQKVGVIPPKKEKKVSWSVKGEKEGYYVISISVSGELQEQVFSAEDSIMVRVIKPLPKGKTWELFQNLFDFFQEWFMF